MEKTRISSLLTQAGGLLEDPAKLTARITRDVATGDLYDPEYERLSRRSPIDASPVEQAYSRLQARQQRMSVPVDLAAIQTEPGGPRDVFLMDGDSLIVSRRRLAVRVSGQIARPGMITFREGERFGYYLDMAGGVSSNADKSEIRIIRAATGLWEEPDDDTVVEPGDTIFVPDKPYVSRWDRFKDIVLIASQVATVILVFTRI